MSESITPGEITPLTLNFETNDVDEYAEILKSFHTPSLVAPEMPESFQLRSKMVISGGICLSQTNSSAMKLNFHDVFDGYGITLPSSGGLSVDRVRGGVIHAAKGCGLVVDSASVVGVNLQAIGNIDRIAVKTSDLHKRLSELIDQPILNRVRFEPSILIGGSTATLVSSLIKIIQDGTSGEAPLTKYPAALTSLREAVLNLIIEGMPNNYSEFMGGRVAAVSSKSVRFAIDYMTANASRPITLSDIAAFSNTSVRALQAGFIQFKGVSPMAYLRMIRLNGAKSELSQNYKQKTVAEIAYSWGFSHHSAFSAHYQKAFGEKPSETYQLHNRR